MAMTEFDSNLRCNSLQVLKGSFFYRETLETLLDTPWASSFLEWCDDCQTLWRRDRRHIIYVCRQFTRPEGLLKCEAYSTFDLQYVRKLNQSNLPQDKHTWPSDKSFSSWYWMFIMILDKPYVLLKQIWPFMCS